MGKEFINNWINEVIDLLKKLLIIIIMVDLKIIFVGLILKNFVIISSLGFINSVVKNVKLEVVGVGVIVLKLLFEE